MLKAFRKEDGSRTTVLRKDECHECQRGKKERNFQINMMDLTLEPCERGQK
jgi:hypothetical protein